MNWVHWSLLSAFSAGLTAGLAEAVVARVDSNFATAVRTSVVLLIVWDIAFAVGKPSEMSGFSGRTWAFLALSGVAARLSWPVPWWWRGRRSFERRIHYH
jgi:transporter family protein